MPGPKPRPFDCPEPVFWYLVGLIATDGCLGKNRCSINITAKGREFLSQIRATIGSRGGISPKFGALGSLAHQLQFKSRALWDRLAGIGLTPKKSLTIGPLNVPDSWFRDFLRGVIDGDGNIRRWRYPTNGREQWSMRIYSASPRFLQWIRETVHRLWRVSGRVYVRAPQSPRHHPLHTLKFGKIAAKVNLGECYYPNSLALERKRKLAAECADVSVGWSKSKTVRDAARWWSWNYVHVFARPPRSQHAQDTDIDPGAGLAAEIAYQPGWLNWQKRGA